MSARCRVMDSASDQVVDSTGLLVVAGDCDQEPGCLEINDTLYTAITLSDVLVVVITLSDRICEP